jgi:hypothetical protein
LFQIYGYQDSVSPSLSDILDSLEQVISDSETNFKHSFTANAETLPIETGTTVVVALIYTTCLVAKMLSDIDSKAKFNLLLGPGGFFLPNMARVWLDNRAVATSGWRGHWGWRSRPGCRSTGWSWR